MKNAEQIADFVKKTIAEMTGCEPAMVIRDANLVDDIGADSLDTVEIIMALEDEFVVDIDDEVVCDWKTVGDFIDGIIGLSRTAAAASA